MNTTPRTRTSRIPIAERFQSKLALRPSGCLEFTGARDHFGYGRIGEGGKYGRPLCTHRVAWEIANGPIPDGLWVLHHCDNPPCVQTEPTEGYPDGHLFLGTPADNSQDMAAKGRSYWRQQTHCKHGHPFDEGNTIISRAGYRQCRECILIRGRRPKACAECGKSVAVLSRHMRNIHPDVPFTSPRGRPVGS